MSYSDMFNVPEFYQNMTLNKNFHDDSEADQKQCVIKVEVQKHEPGLGPSGRHKLNSGVTEQKQQ